MACLLNSKDEEKLAEEVRRYPVIYDLSNKAHKENNVVENAWEEISKALDFVEPHPKRTSFTL